MEEMEDMAEFQQAKSEFAEIVKYLIKEVAAHITHLEDHMLMVPQQSSEKHSERDAFRDFRRAFRDLYLLTFNTVRNQDLKRAVDLWFKHPYRSEDKYQVFQIGMDFAQQYITEMYNLGLLDLNVSTPVDFPFEDMIRDVAAEKARLSMMKMDISHDLSSDRTGRSPLQSDLNDKLVDTSDEPMDIEALVNMEDPAILEQEDENYDMFAEQRRNVDEIEDEDID